MKKFVALAVFFLVSFGLYTMFSSAEIERHPSSDSSERVYEVHGHKFPLHNLESVPAGEMKAVEELNEIMRGLFKNEYGNRQGGVVDRPTGMRVEGSRRGVHPRSHGCVKGRFTVNSDFQGRVGMFSAGATYDVTARFSNASPKVSDSDSGTDVRGFAMKVHGVPGRTVLSQVMGLGDEASQDFTLNSSEPFFADNAERYGQFMKILTFESATLDDAGLQFVKKLVLSGHPVVAYRVTKAFLAIQAIKATTPLGLSYFSILPFQYGEGPSAPVVKFKMQPCQGNFDDPVPTDSRLYLRENLRKRMASEGACFDFMVQQRLDPKWTIEDGTQAWPQDKSPYLPIAKIEFPAQDLMEEMICEKLVVNPWNTLPEHKPVGGINRIRLPTYLLSVQERRSTNRY